MRVVSDRGGLVYRFMYAQMTNITQTQSGCRIELENGESFRLDVAEGSLRPLVHCTLQARKFLQLQEEQHEVQCREV